jgi:hypothetical protein
MHRNIIIALLVCLVLVWVLFKGLAHAWMALGVLKFGFIILAFVAVGWIWGRLSK